MAQCMSAEDLVEYTDKDRPTAQARELDAMGIPYRKRRNGSLAVLWIHVRTIEGHASTLPVKPEPQLILD